VAGRNAGEGWQNRRVTDIVLPVARTGATARRHGAHVLARILAWLRLCAIAGQTLAVAVAVSWLEMPVPVVPLVAGIAVLGGFAAWVFWRLAQPEPITRGGVVAHITVDTTVLCYLLYLTGGATNPFVSLLVMPITLAAAALPLRYVGLLAGLAAAGYLFLMRFHVPLAHMHLHGGESAFDLHVAGMAINFVITAAMLGYFIARLAQRLREREAEVQIERERALRDEGILAIAIQAAGAAHGLNTPLSTMRILLGELRAGHGDVELGRDLQILSEQADRCHAILRELVAAGREQLAAPTERIPAAAFVAECVEQFGLLRPEIELTIDIADPADERLIDAEPALRHALISLLNNAADASRSADSDHIELGVANAGAFLEFRVRDRGKGDLSTLGARRPYAFRSDKRDGLGLGLALANATAERLGGELIAELAPDGGLCQCLRIRIDASGDA
jgi:two-component system sensor histidine kinase RegB